MPLFDDKSLPVVFTSNGRDYDFHSDYREWIRFESLITNTDVPEKMVAPLSLQLIFPKKVPEDLKEAMSFILYFYRGGNPPASVPAAVSKTIQMESRRVYSFEYDWEYIYAAFFERYNIDICNVKYMHWWKFRALFKSLHDCKFTEIMGYRAVEITNDIPEKRREFLQDMQEKFALPVSLTEQRKIETARRFLDGV